MNPSTPDFRFSKQGLFALLFLITALFSACHTEKLPQREKLDLAGNWAFALDSAGVGEQQKWFLNELAEEVKLPGTTDMNQKGYSNTDTANITMHLQRIYTYEGAAWYQRRIDIPRNFENKHLQLFLERSKISKVWIDSFYVGGSKLLESPQLFDVTEYLGPGRHLLTIKVDNDLKLTPYGNVHIYSDDTQTNWNGIIGKMHIEASDKTFIKNIKVYPDIEQKKIKVQLQVENQLNLPELNIRLKLSLEENGKTTFLRPFETTLPSQELIELEYQLGDEMRLWDEYDRPLYSLTATISNGDIEDSYTVPFGMRKFGVEGSQFTINGRKTFLRGKHEAAVFPLSGHTPMNVEDWQRVYRIAKDYGINHYRFHSYCPPEAAFTAADREGIYLQAELPFWGGLEADSVAAMQLNEGLALMDAYANHPSFVMFSHGNELWSGHEKAAANILAIKEYDPRPLYTLGSNCNIGYRPPEEWADFFVAARTPSDGDTTLTHIRLTHAFADSRDGGILNGNIPSTDINFNHAVSQIGVPIVSHEIGQYQIYPDYDEIEKYTGVLRASNLEEFRQRLQKSGMGEMDHYFQQASGAWSALCYKAEMEAALRTEGFGGFQLLDLQDFPGQGTALVGILDAFMDSKEVVTEDDWKQSCDDVVLLLEMPKFCWITSEKTFSANLKVANYSNKSLESDIDWKVYNKLGQVLRKGKFEKSDIKNGGLSSMGKLEFPIDDIKSPEMLNLVIEIPETRYSNSYNIWLYPEQKEIQPPKDILISREFDNEVLENLDSGGKVLYFPKTEDIADKSVPGLFPPDFWNYGMFKGISEWVKKPVSPGTLCILTKSHHAIFEDFPTEFHTNWQWYSIIKASNSFILDKTPADYRPIVQVIDNLERNHKMGLIFEFIVGEGKLLVCTAQLPDIMDHPEAAQLYHSILKYMDSDKFEPEFQMPHSLFGKITGTKK